MVEKEGYRINDIYQGGYSSIKPPSGNMYITTGSLGLTIDPRNANILQEVSSKLSTGVKQIEIEAVIPEVFDSMPKQHLKEINRLSKLTGIDVSMHGPVINTSGINQQGFSETEREASERRIADTLLRSHELNPKGNIPVNFHSSEGIPGSQMLPPSKRKKDDEYKRMIIVNQESGRMAPLEPEIEYRPEMKELKAIPITPEHRLENLNKTEWKNTISQLTFNKERADEILHKSRDLLEPLLPYILSKKITKPEQLPNPQQQQAFRNFRTAMNYLEDVHTQASDLFSKAYEFGDDHKKQILKSISNDFRKKLEKNPNDPFLYAQAMDDFMDNLKKPAVIPEMWVPIEDFALDKSSQTYGNAAFEAYKKYKSKAPVLLIENPPAGAALSTGKDIRNIVEKSREKFVEKAVESGMSKSIAKTQAEKLIGATWDLGHINMLRKYGYTEKEIIAESKHVKPVLKHVHLSDNFGFEHTELPMGMGNVPMKQIMEKLGKEGFEATKVIEAAQWWQHFKTPPVQETMEATGSPVYSMKMAPYWNQAPGLYQGYFSGLEGPWLPQTHYETFGTGFARLPQELGGQSPGGQGSRMSGRPME